MNGREQISLNKDKFLLKDLRKLVTTYKVLEKEEDRQKYLNMLRLRSLSSQYNSITALLKDGFFYPWLTFICKQGNEQRILELDFVEDTITDKYKDHCQRSYNFSMIKRINKDLNEDKFTVEFSNETQSYQALVPG